MRPAHRHALLWLLVVAAVALPALPGLVTGGALIPGDAPEIPLPGLVAAGAAAAAGHLPTWTESLYLGVPLPSAGGVGMRYPPNLLFAVLGAGGAYTLLLAAHLLLAAGGSAALARAHGSSRVAAAIAALAFGCGGFVVGHTENLVRIEAIAWTPWMFLGAEWLVRARPRAGAALLGLAAGAALLTGYLPFAVYALGWVTLYGIGRAWQVGRLGPSTTAGVGALGVATLICAAQLLPMVAMLPLAAQGHAPEPGFAVDNSLHPAQILDLLAPLAWTGSGWDVQAVGHLGLLPLGLAGLALRHPIGRLIVGLSALSLVLALGENLPGYNILTVLLPPLQILGRPYRLFIGAAALLPLAAALGWDQAARGNQRRLLLALPIAALVVRLVARDPALALPTGLGLLACIFAVGRRPSAVVLLLALELATTNARLLGLTGPSPLAPRPVAQPQSAAWLQQNLGKGARYLSLREPDFDSAEQLWMQSPLRWGLPAIQDGTTTLIPWWFADALGGPEPPGRGALALVRAQVVLTARPGVFAGAPELARFGEVAVRALDPPGPRSFLASTWHTAPRDTVVARLRSATTRQELTQDVLLEHAPEGSGLPPVPPAPAAGGDCGQQALIDQGPGHLTLAVDLDQPCLLVITDGWHPAWTASRAGEPLPVLRAWGTLQAVALPEGAATVHLEVRPWDQWLGMVLTLVGLLTCAVLALSARRGGGPRGAVG